MNPAGGGVSAWPSADREGDPAVAVREDFPDGAVQTGARQRRRRRANRRTRGRALGTGRRPRRLPAGPDRRRGDRRRAGDGARRRASSSARRRAGSSPAQATVSLGTGAERERSAALHGRARRAARCPRPPARSPCDSTRAGSAAASTAADARHRHLRAGDADARHASARSTASRRPCRSRARSAAGRHA